MSQTGWDTSSVTNMSGMFFGCIVFDQPLNGFDVSGVTDMSSMFSGCIVFNQPLDTWVVANVTNMNSLFENCSEFNQIIIASWDFSSLESMVGMITNTGYTTAQFTELLVNLNDNPELPQNLTLGTTNLTYYNNVSLPNLTTIAESAILQIYGSTCFLANTPVNTDQGIIMIDQIDPTIHTIRTQKIVAITTNITRDKYLVKIEKDAFYTNVPSVDTFISCAHKILYKGNMIQANDFIGVSDKITKYKYNNEVLYNVLLEKHSKMVINNLIVETLHPEHRIAKLYNTFNFDKMDVMQQIYVMEELNNIILSQN